MSARAIDFDSPWKEAIEQYLPFLFALFFPHIHADIDWSRPPRFLDTELQRALRGAKTGRRVADKPVQVWLKQGRDV